MKKKILALALMLLTALSIGFAACKKPEEETPPNPKANQTVYGFATTQNTSHSGLAFATIKTDADGNVTDRYLDEAFIPMEWAKITVQDALALGATWDEEVETKLLPGPAVLIAPISSGGSWNNNTAPTFYPKYIELTLDGVTQVYMGRMVTITNNSGNTTYGEAAETQIATDEPIVSTHADFAGTVFASNTNGCVRYYPVGGFGQSPATDAKSLEYKLSTEYNYAKAYVETLHSYELAKTNPVNVNTAAIKYLKDTVTKINTVRLAARRDFAAQNNTAAATDGSIAVGRAMKASGGAELTGANLSYAETFFKRGSTYDSRMKTLPVVDGQLNLTADIGTPVPATGERSTWEGIDRGLQAFLDSVGIANLNATELLKLEKTGNVFKYNFGTTATPNVVSFASAYHTNIYLAVYARAYSRLNSLT